MKTTYEEAVIHRLFAVMREKYGSYFVILIGDEPMPVIKARWQEALKDLTAKEIGNALETIKQSFPERPPNMFQFVTFVKNLKHCKIGHGSNKTFDYGEMGRTSLETGNNYLKAIRSGL